MEFIQIIDYAGIALFAATGALAASRKQLDLIGFLFLGVVTAIGGGTLRDVVLDVPVFWVAQPGYILVPAVAAIVVYFTAHMMESRYQLLLWIDAVGLAAYCVFGAWKGLAVTGSPVIAVVMGVLTATFGGVIRDVMTGEPSVLLRPEIYITAALTGATGFVLMELTGAPLIVSSLVAAGAAFCVRAGALIWGWTFPRYKPRPGRAPEDII